jgi:cytochrome c oxidase subunit 2
MAKPTFALVGLTILLIACVTAPFFRPPSRGMVWGPGSFDSLGEQIYFTGMDGDGDRIRYSGGPTSGMMMDGYLSCASCHGPDARGGTHVMHMEVMEAPDIRWSALAGEGHEGEDHAEEEGHGEEYDLETFRRAVVDGQHPDGDELDRDMPRWRMSDESLEALQEYLESLD